MKHIFQKSTLCCGITLELPQNGSFNEIPQHVFFKKIPSLYFVSKFYVCLSAALVCANELDNSMSDTRLNITFFSLFSQPLKRIIENDQVLNI